MTVVKIIARVLLVGMMLLVVFQFLVVLFGFAATMDKTPEAWGYITGRFLGATLLLSLFSWLFRKLGSKKSVPS